MAERAYDLYLDESGSFEKKGEHTLIGGVMIPHEQNLSFEVFSSWEEEIRSSITDSGVYGQDHLALGDEWHVLLQKKKRKRIMTSAENQRFLELDKVKKYVFDHCCENDKSPERWKAQGWVLKEYLKKLKSLGGVPVVFDNPNGIYYIDSNTTFMSIFAGGFVKLYNSLMEQYPGDQVVIYVHAASRFNVTREKEKEQYEVSPLAGKGISLEKKLYTNQIENYVFLNGGYNLLGLKGYTDSVESFEILYDLVVEGKEFPIPNPATVICDYVCNCFFADLPKRKYGETLKEYGLLLIQAFGKNPDLSEAKIEYYAERHDWISYLKFLISKEFPENLTEAFFSRMHQDSINCRYDQQLCVDGLVNYLKSFVDNRETMPLWLSRLDMIMDQSDHFSDVASLSLKANLLIYKHTLLTHLGRDVSSTQAAFADCVHNIRPLEERDYLLTLFCNRQVVTETDCFNYEKGHEWFGAVQQYFIGQLKNSDELMDWFSVLSNAKKINAVSVEYGKALGSFVQLLTKEYRVASSDKKPLVRKQAEEAVHLAFRHLSESNDRANQNACDFYVEIGEYEKAMRYLALSVSEGSQLGESFEAQATGVLEKCGLYGEKNSFVYLHYVSMMHRCFRNKDPHGDVMLSLILRNRIGKDSFGHFFGNPHPGAVILRHVAASLARGSGEKKIAQKLFDDAFSFLMNRGELFETIAMSVRAEMLALGLEGKLPGDESSWMKKTDEYFSYRLPDYSERAVHNPFAELVKDISSEGKVDVLYRIADAVVY